MSPWSTSSCRPLSRDSESFSHDAVHDGLGQVIADARDEGHGILSRKIPCPNKVGHGKRFLRGVDRKGRCGRSVETDESRESIVHGQHQRVQKNHENQDHYHRSSGLKDAVSGTGHSVEDDQEDDTLLKNGKGLSARGKLSLDQGPHQLAEDRWNEDGEREPEEHPEHRQLDVAAEAEEQFQGKGDGEDGQEISQHANEKRQGDVAPAEVGHDRARGHSDRCRRNDADTDDEFRGQRQNSQDPEKERDHDEGRDHGGDRSPEPAQLGSDAGGFQSQTRDEKSQEDPDTQNAIFPSPLSQTRNPEGHKDNDENACEEPVLFKENRHVKGKEGLTLFRKD